MSSSSNGGWVGFLYWSYRGLIAALNCHWLVLSFLQSEGERRGRLQGADGGVCGLCEECRWGVVRRGARLTGNVSQSYHSATSSCHSYHYNFNITSGMFTMFFMNLHLPIWDIYSSPSLSFFFPLRSTALSPPPSQHSLLHMALDWMIQILMGVWWQSLHVPPDPPSCKAYVISEPPPLSHAPTAEL